MIMKRLLFILALILTVTSLFACRSAGEPSVVPETTLNRTDETTVPETTNADITVDDTRIPDTETERTPDTTSAPEPTDSTAGTDPVTDPSTTPAVTTKPVTTPVTTKPVTTPVTTKPVTTPVTTKPVTTPVTTKPVTTTVTTEPPVPEIPMDIQPGYQYESFNQTTPLEKNGADPFITYKDGFWYYCFTDGSNLYVKKCTGPSDFNRTNASRVLSRVEGAEYTTSIWAPELHYINGVWYIYYTAGSSVSNHRMYVAEGTSSDPTDPFVYKAKLYESSDTFSIDGTVMIHNGQLYFIWAASPTTSGGSESLYIARMKSPTELVDERVQISNPKYQWETRTSSINEGPIVLKKNGRVFILYSASDASTRYYCIGLLTLQDGADPMNKSSWVKTKTALFSQTDEVFGPGHCCFFEDASGVTWIAYHAKTTTEQRFDDRVMRIQPIGFADDGTPYLGSPVSPSTTLHFAVSAK